MKRYRMLKILLVLSLLVPFESLSFILKPAFGSVDIEPSEIEPPTRYGFGLQTTTFRTPQGDIRVNLPDDIAVGDTISGTVIAEPKGKTEEERRKNLDELNGYVVELEREETPVFKNVLKWIVPLGIAGTTIILRDKHGKEVSRTEVPVHLQPQPLPPVSPKPEDYSFPSIAQAGRPFEVIGPFNGDFGNNSLTIGGRKVNPLAESPRKAVFENPGDVIGQTSYEFKEGDVETKGEFNNSRVRLTAPKTTLLRGERTTITTRVEGLKGLPLELYPIELVMTNHTPHVVNFKDTKDNELTHSILHDKVSPGGTYEFKTSIVGVKPGAFHIGGVVKTTRLCGNTVHNSFIDSISKGSRTREGKRVHFVKWRVRCYVGKCNLRRNHERPHSYTAVSLCRIRPRKTRQYTEYFDTREGRDARHRELEKEKEKREAEAGYRPR